VDAELLRIAHEKIGDAVVVHADGEIDILTAPLLREQLQKAYPAASPPQIVVADLTGVRFLGSAGLSVLLEADRTCRARSTPLRVVAPSPATIRPLRVTGIDRVLDVVESMSGIGDH
jgi:anti-sigma B factor antagonist